MLCPGCKEPVRFWQKKCEGNSNWHHRCMITSDNVLKLNYMWSKNECESVGLPTPWELYNTKGSIGERYAHLMNKLLEKYNLTDWYNNERG